MKRQLTMACSVVLLLTGLVLPALGQSNGEISFVAVLTGTDTHQGEECSTWDIKWNNSGPDANTPFGSCQNPVIEVYANLMGASAGGITGCEFRVLQGADGAADPGFVYVEFPETSAIVVLGRAWTPRDPGSRGMRMSWDACQTGENGRVHLETVSLFSTAPCGPSQRPASIDFVAGQHNTPSNAFFRCPLFTLCDDPAFTKVCLGTNITACRTPVPPFCPNCSQCSTSGLFTINGNKGIGGLCNPAPKTGAPSTAAAKVNWSELKELYR